MGSTFARILVFALLFVSAAVDAADRVRVQFEGVAPELLDNIKQLVTIEQQKATASLSDERIGKLHKKALGEIREALQPFGYYRVEIQSDLVLDGAVWNARYVIQPGPRVRVTRLDLKLDGGAERDAAFTKLTKNFPLKVGDALVHAQYEEGKNAFMQLATERGYFDAQYETSEVRVNIEDYTADIVIHFNAGSRFHFGAITFNAPELNSEFLARFAPFKPGDPYSFNELLELQNALTDSDYFSQVEVKPGRDPADPLSVPVSVDALPRDRTKYSMGLGYGTDTGARATLGVERRRVNPSGHRWRADLKLSEIGNSITTRYIIPMANPRTDQFTVTAGRDDQRLAESTTRKYLLTGGYTRLDNGWQKTLFLNYERDEAFEVGTQTGSSTLVMPGVNWTRIKANDRIYTTFGHRFVVEVRGGSETLGSTTSFLQARLNAKFVRRLASWGRVLARGDAGYTEVLNFEELPPSVRFFAGGDFSVRGYDYNSLGPREGGKVIGGTKLLVGGLEYEQLLDDHWSAAVFYDVGNAVDDFSEPLARAFGAGIRYRSPIGLIRIDLARPLDDLGKSRYLHISIGPDL